MYWRSVPGPAGTPGSWPPSRRARDGHQRGKRRQPGRGSRRPPHGGRVRCRRAHGDRNAGRQAAAPYDRVIATYAVDDVPWAWIEQTRPGGCLVVPWAGSGTSR
ncbi:hypothetical protein ACFXEL_03980 [Streptomyces sp. NPDC059382]|uniref:hypothetical protein n=1 Tax=Streptomyces sp. NPDC059382 TaxID=3346816 RepID=UPI0036A83007